MLQKFYDNTIQSNYIKYLLQHTYIPTVPFVKNINHITKNQIYIYDNYFVRARLSEETREIFYHLNQNPDLYNKYFERFDPYIFGKQYKGLTTNYVSNSGTYDSETHYYLGQYLRAYKAYYDIDLMPFYNCFSDEYVSNISLNVNKNQRAPYISITEETNSNYKIISVPICFCKEYTIALDSDSEILCVPVLLGKKGILSDLTNKLWSTLNVSTHAKLHLKSNYIYNQCSFSNPTYFFSPCVPGTDDLEQLSLLAYEKYLRLLIRVPITNNSSITILEGHYSNIQSTCDRIINLDNDEVNRLHNTAGIELPIKSVIDSNIENRSLNSSFDNINNNINKIICRGFQSSFKSCTCITPPESQILNGITHKLYSSIPLTIDNKQLVVSNIVRKNRTIIKSGLVSYSDLNIDPSTYSVNLLDIFGRGKVFVVGNSNQFIFKNQIISKSLNELQNTYIEIDEYSKLIYSLSNPDESIENSITDYSKANQQHASDVLLSNGNICLTYFKNLYLDGRYDIPIYDTHTGSPTYEGTFTLVFKPNSLNKLTGTVSVQAPLTYDHLDGTYLYTIDPNDSSLELIRNTQLIQNWKIQLGYKAIKQLDSTPVNIKELVLSKYEGYIYDPQLYIGVIPEVLGASDYPFQKFGAIQLNNSPELFIETHQDDLSNALINLVDPTLGTTEQLNNNFIGNNQNYLEIRWPDPKRTVVTTYKHLPLQYWSANQIIEGTNVFTEYLNKYLLTNLSLLKINDHNSYAFTSRLYEYLVNHVVASTEQFEQNIKNIQNKLQVSNSEFWTEDLRINLYYIVQSYLNNYNLPNIDDINGFLDKDSEKILKSVNLSNFLTSLQKDLEPFIESETLNFNNLQLINNILNKWKSQVYYITFFKNTGLFDYILQFQKSFVILPDPIGSDDIADCVNKFKLLYDRLKILTFNM